ncbi:MAG TPA: HigA family addiction module antitoxin, partial [Sphingomicrobium sp.]
GVSAVTISHIVNGHAPITAAMALRLGYATGTKPQYWLKLQSEYDLYRAKQLLAPALKKIPRVPERTGAGKAKHSSM